MTTPVKWALAVGVLVLAVIVAVLPRDDPAPGPAPAPPPASDALAPARAKAALPPCPDGAGTPITQLDGVYAQCLGDGVPIDLGTALSGGPTLVNLWATWCEPCKRELPTLSEYAARPGAVRVLAVQVASKPADGLELLAGLGVRLPVVYDGDGFSGPVRAALKAPSTLPASYLITADGRVKFIEDPRLFTSVEQIAATVGGMT
ncbi:TlpA family protein disulfide reductase [Amycolatopsis anabasis]|uniref:TlpA family protein disulfide reductase n=1 Tax=Amycolatopsis anabasis TaxID=1840409 RepID=UPI00131B30C9|nr:TlpA disulfide reductase family protein [Amycolatopsis anabasis]